MFHIDFKNIYKPKLKMAAGITLYIPTYVICCMMVHKKDVSKERHM